MQHGRVELGGAAGFGMGDGAMVQHRGWLWSTWWVAGVRGGEGPAAQHGGAEHCGWQRGGGSGAAWLVGLSSVGGWGGGERAAVQPGGRGWAGQRRMRCCVRLAHARGEHRGSGLRELLAVGGEWGSTLGEAACACQLMTGGRPTEYFIAPCCTGVLVCWCAESGCWSLQCHAVAWPACRVRISEPFFERDVLAMCYLH